MQIYVAEGTQHTGPFDLETIKEGLRTGRFQSGQLAWYEGAPGWEPLSQLPGLAGTIPPPPPPASAATPYQAPYQAPAPAPVYYPPSAYTPRRESRWLFVIGLVAGLVALAVGVYTMSRGLRSDHASNSSPAPATPAPTAAAAPTVAVAPPVTTPANNHLPPIAPAVPGTGTRHFVANRAKYSGNLAAHFVAFSFDYPEGWTVLENVSDEYVEVHHYVQTPNGRGAAVESISISYAYSGPGTALAPNLPRVGGHLLEMAATALTGRYPEAEKTQARSGRYGRYPAQEQFFTVPEDEDTQTPARFFRQAIVARSNGPGPDGLFVTVFGSEMGGDPDAESLGKSGGLRTIEDSFRFDP